jgi:ribonuclease P protein subunit POP4
VKVTPNIIRHELIGIKGRIVKNACSSLKGLSGTVIDETRNTFTFQTGDKRRMVAKDSGTFRFMFSDRTEVEIEGGLLVARPEDRLKKSIRRLW